MIEYIAVISLADLPESDGFKQKMLEYFDEKDGMFEKLAYFTCVKDHCRAISDDRAVKFTDFLRFHGFTGEDITVLK